MNDTLGFIGLGALGRPMARVLLDAGYRLKLFNRTVEKASEFAVENEGVTVVERPADAVPAGGLVVSVVADDDALESVVMSEGFLEALAPGGLHLSMSTVSPELSRRLAALHAERGSLFVEAPVFGRPEAAAARQLWICVAGPEAAKARVQPLLDILGQGSYDFGEAYGAALLVKLVGNFLIVSAGQCMREALDVAGHGGVDPAKAIEMLTQTLFAAPIYQSYGPRIAQNPAQIPSSWIGIKDVGLLQDVARQAGLSTPVAGVVQQLQAQGRQQAQ